MLDVMNRRTFAGALAGLAAARPMWPAPPQDASSRRTQFYTMDVFQLKQGTQSARIHDWIQNTLLAKMSKIHPGPKIVLESVIAPHNPQILFIVGFSAFEEIWTTLSGLSGPDVMAAWDKIEHGSEPPYESEALSIYQAAPYSPEIVPQKHDQPRYFELRQYHSPTASQLKAVHERFNGPEIRVFHRSGIHPILYTSGLFGANLPNLTYLIPFDSLGAREKAWDAFNADPEWIKARKESIDAHGQIVAVTDVSIYHATPYSPVS
jgi:NIPSNAP